MLQGTLPDEVDLLTSTWSILNPGTARWLRDHVSANTIIVMKAVSLQTETVPWEGKGGEKTDYLGPAFLRVISFSC